jgi:hypothetical protein
MTNVFGQQIISNQNKGNIFCDQSAGSRLERLKLKAMTNYTNSQPKNGIVVKKDDKRSISEALSRARAGGYVPHTKWSNKVPLHPIR